MAKGQLHLDDGTDTLDLYLEKDELGLILNQLDCNEIYVRGVGVLRHNKVWRSSIELGKKHYTDSDRDTMLKMKHRDVSVTAWYQYGDTSSEKLYWDGSTTSTPIDRVQNNLRFAKDGVPWKYPKMLNRTSLSVKFIENI